MNLNISISLFRVSADGKFLDVVIDCPTGYQFSKFELQANYRVNKQDYEDLFDIGDPTFKELAEVTEDGKYKYRLSLKTHWVIRIPIETQLGINVPAIYTGTFKAIRVKKQHCSFIEEAQDDWNHQVFGEEDVVHNIMVGPDELPEAVAICSDVSNVYRNMLDGVINVSGACDKVSDDVIRTYLILYAHQEAMRLNHFSDAVLYFNMINNNFNLCGNFARSGTGPSCGCERSTITKISTKSGGASCGCGKK